VCLVGAERLVDRVEETHGVLLNDGSIRGPAIMEAPREVVKASAARLDNRGRAAYIWGS
jgi:hypothetical protein